MKVQVNLDNSDETHNKFNKIIAILLSTLSSILVVLSYIYLHSMYPKVLDRGGSILIVLMVLWTIGNHVFVFSKFSEMKNISNKELIYSFFCFFIVLMPLFKIINELINYFFKKTYIWITMSNANNIWINNWFKDYHAALTAGKKVRYIEQLAFKLNDVTGAGRKIAEQILLPIAAATAEQPLTREAAILALENFLDDEAESEKSKIITIIKDIANDNSESMGLRQTAQDILIDKDMKHLINNVIEDKDKVKTTYNKKYVCDCSEYVCDCDEELCLCDDDCTCCCEYCSC